MTKKEAIDVLKHNYPSACFTNLCEAVEIAIQALSAQTKQRWIPCEKGLPEEETYVLISKKISPLSGKKWCVTVAGRFIDGRSRKVEWRDIGFGRIHDDDVLAWMPLPEPYKAERREG